ncbi:MAG TPA: hypothetical protein PK081_03770 [Bacteroidales bacterium]|nr:hypothetical protein [Bacteroidales bacterium]
MHLVENNRVQVTILNGDDNWDLMNPRLFYMNVIYDYTPLRGVLFGSICELLKESPFFDYSSV